VSGDEGGRAPDPSDLGSDWVEALLGDAPRRSAGAETPTRAPVAKPNLPTGVPLQPEDLEDNSWIEALLSSPSKREPGISGPIPMAEPEPEVQTPEAQSPEVESSEVESSEVESQAPLSPVPPDQAPPSAAPDLEPHARTPEEVTRPYGAAGQSHIVEAPLFRSASADPPPPLELVPDAADPSDAAGPWGLFKAPESGELPPITPGAGPGPIAAPAPMELPYADDDSHQEPPRSPSVAVAGATAALSRGTIPPRADVPEPLAALPLERRVLDLRPPPGGGSEQPQARKTSSGDGGRRRALIIAGAAAILIVALVGAQLATEQDDDDGGAVITADAASVEAPEDGTERGVSLGAGASGDGDVDVRKGDAAEDTDGSTVQGNDAGEPADDPASGDGSSGGSAPSGRLTISTDRLDLGSSGSGGVQLSNSGGASLSFSASTSGGGYGVSPGSGSISPGQTVTLQVGFNQGSLPEGTANGALRINASGSYTVALAAQVNRPPAISSVGWQSCGPTSLLKAHVEDETGEPVAKVEMIGTAPNGAAFRETAVWYGYGNYRAEIGPFSANGAIRYYVQATDSRGNVARSGTVNDSWSNGC
jgi:hypothetical protein